MPPGLQSGLSLVLYMEGPIGNPKVKPDARSLASRFCPPSLLQVDLGGRATLASPGTSGSSVLYMPSENQVQGKNQPPPSVTRVHFLIGASILCGVGQGCTC